MTEPAPPDGSPGTGIDNRRSETTPATDIAVVRRTLRRLTLGVALVVLVSIPALYGFIGVRASYEHAVLEASVTAEQVARHAGAKGPAWRQAADELAMILSRTSSPGMQVARTLMDPTGAVIQATAAPVDPPMLRARAAVELDGAQIGEAAVAVSLRALLTECALVLAFAAVLAAGLHMVIDRVALRALRHALDHLQSAVSERDHALLETSEALALLERQNTRLKSASEELSRARDAALSADRSKSMFLAAMSHELRTPLNAIIGFSEIMARQLYGPIGHDKYRDYAADIRASGDHLLALIDDVLDLSRVEAGKLTLQREPLNVAEQVEACCRLVQGRAADAGIDLTLTRQPDAAVRILGDRVRFRQILLNLLTNAVKFTERGGAVRVDVEAVPDRMVTVRIADTGIGMSSADLERVFRPFERVDVRASRPTEGAGLGLALSRALVHEHEGDLHIASVRDQGTTVTLTFPGLAGSTRADGRQMSLQDALGDDGGNAA